MRANARQVLAGELTYSVLVVDSLAEVEQPARGEMTRCSIASMGNGSAEMRGLFARLTRTWAAKE